MAHRIVFVNGCFDIIHRGHVELFEFAKSCGDYLVVALDTDDRVRNSKGDSRPFNCLSEKSNWFRAR
jgi:D-beta-D-heptose 7-phosphate kinase/D-beta-D-heptose 1-phosphate adenosyltransferase